MTFTQLDLVEKLTDAGGKPAQRVLDDLERVKAMNLCTDTMGPLKILATVHAAKVSGELPCVSLSVSLSVGSVFVFLRCFGVEALLGMN